MNVVPFENYYAQAREDPNKHGIHAIYGPAHPYNMRRDPMVFENFGLMDGGLNLPRLLVIGFIGFIIFRILCKPPKSEVDKLLGL